jgi:hypothetical protein
MVDDPQRHRSDTRVGGASGEHQTHAFSSRRLPPSEPDRKAAHRAALTSGLATGIGSLPFADASAAAALALRMTPELPAVPQLPARSRHEDMLTQWLRALPEVSVDDDGTWSLDPDADPMAPLDFSFDARAHGGMLAFCVAAAALSRAPSRIKAQVTGPLTLGCALTDSGMPAEIAFERAAELVRGWGCAIERHFTERFPDAALVVFFDEPALVRWNSAAPPVDHDVAGDALSSACASITVPTGVHVCGDGDLQLALAAGPDIIGVEVRSGLIDHAPALARFLEADGLIAWGAVPTDRPVGESAAPLWKALVELWCELTRRGCDGLRIRSQAIITPACGLAGHGTSQAERALWLARELAIRVFDQVAATKLTVGA